MFTPPFLCLLDEELKTRRGSLDDAVTTAVDDLGGGDGDDGGRGVVQDLTTRENDLNDPERHLFER